MTKRRCQSRHCSGVRSSPPARCDPLPRLMVVNIPVRSARLLVRAYKERVFAEPTAPFLHDAGAKMFRVHCKIKRIESLDTLLKPITRGGGINENVRPGDSAENLVLVLPVVALLGARAALSRRSRRRMRRSPTSPLLTNNAVKLQPGKWQTVVKILSIDAPGLPAQMAGPMKQQMSAMGAQTVETCVTPEMAAKPPENMFGGAQNCTYEKFEMTGGKIDATLVCKGGCRWRTG